MDSGANIIHDPGDGVLVLTTSDTTPDSWVIDSGASFHASSCSEAFTNYKEGKFGNVYLGDNKACEIVGKGDILLSIKGGGQLLLQDVRYVPKLKRNLISVSQLYAQGFLTLLTDTWKITKGSMVIARGDKVGSLYVVETNDEVGAAMTFLDNDAALWHQILGHMSKKGL